MTAAYHNRQAACRTENQNNDNACIYEYWRVGRERLKSIGLAQSPCMVGPIARAENGHLRCCGRIPASRKHRSVAHRAFQMKLSTYVHATIFHFSVGL